MNRVRESMPWPLQGNGSTAHHEAGHLLAGHLLGMTVGNAVMGKDGGKAAVSIGQAPCRMLGSEDISTQAPSVVDVMGYLFDMSYPERWPGKSYKEAAQAYCTMLVAGRQAEIIHAGVDLPPCRMLLVNDDDHRRVEALLHHTGQRLAMGGCQHQARRILLEHWPLVELIAKGIEATSVLQVMVEENGHRDAHTRELLQVDEQPEEIRQAMELLSPGNIVAGPPWPWPHKGAQSRGFPLG